MKGVGGSDELWEVCQDKSLLLTTPLSVCKAVIKQLSGNFGSSTFRDFKEDGGAEDEAAQAEEAAGQGGEAQEAGGGEWLLGGDWVLCYLMICDLNIWAGKEQTIA